MRRCAPSAPELHALLASAVLALASGARTVSDLFRFVQELSPAQRRALRFRSAPDNPNRVPPLGDATWLEEKTRARTGHTAALNPRGEVPWHDQV